MKLSAIVASVVVLTGGGPVSAQLPDGWPARLDAEVRALIGERWDVPVDDVRLSWGSLRGAVPGEDASPELVGSGRGGQWVVRILSSTGEASTARLRSGHAATIATAGRALGRGEALAVEDVVLRDTVVWMPPVAGDELPTEGWVAHRPIAKGEALSSPSVRPPLAVESGSPVVIVLNTGSVAVRMPGTALGSGAVGDEVYVRTESGTRLRGRIVGPAAVRLQHADSRALQGGSRG